MIAALYEYFRVASGFSLIVAGFSFLFRAKPAPSFRSVGTMFLSVGSLFTLSALDSILPLPAEVGNFAVTVLVFAVSQSLFELILSLFSTIEIRKARRRVYVTGGILSFLLWALPLLDPVIGWKTPGTSVEDGQSLGLLHDFLGPLLYCWPVVVTVWAARIASVRSGDLSLSFPGVRTMVLGLGALAVVLTLATVGLASGNSDLYRWAHTLLEALMLAWYFYINAKPDQFDRFRRDLAWGRDRNRQRESAEDRELDTRLTQIVQDESFLRNPGLGLELLAKKVGVPGYRLSEHFHRRLRTSFSAWLNRVRIGWVCRRMAEDPGAKILDLALDAGYRSKTAFNTQFRALVGLNPTEYRRTVASGKKSALFDDPNSRISEI